jgi:hypothetical protein
MKVYLPKFMAKNKAIDVTGGFVTHAIISFQKKLGYGLFIPANRSLGQKKPTFKYYLDQKGSFLWDFPGLWQG